MNNFIITYIRKLDNESAKIFALNFGISFNDEEIRVILPYLQTNAPYLLTLNNIAERIHLDLDSKININSVNKVCLLISKLGYH